MSKTILITGATDGIGLETAQLLLTQKHQVILHGRNQAKLDKVIQELSHLGHPESIVADLSDINAVRILSKKIVQHHKHLDVLINNAGVLNTPTPKNKDGIDTRFLVNTIAPYYLTKLLWPILDNKSRVINLSSAAQASVNFEALTNNSDINEMDAYSQSKLALTMWSFALAHKKHNNGPIIIAVNPGSFLGSKMVKESFNMEGKSLAIGANILAPIALSDQFANASGQYYDNDSGQFTNPHPDALDNAQCQQVVDYIESLLINL